MSSPSGAGKTSISKKLLKIDKLISLSISCTTRPKRKGEIHKKDYIFLSEKKFSEAVSKNDIIGMYFEPETNSLVFKKVDPKDALSASAMINSDKSDKIYDN